MVVSYDCDAAAVNVTVGNSAPSLTLTWRKFTTTPNIAAVTLGFSVRLSSTADTSVGGKKRSTGDPGASADGSLPMMRRKFERVVVSWDSAVSCWGRAAASR